MKTIFLSKLISMAPDANTCLVAEKLNMAVCNEESIIFAVFVRFGEKAVLVPMTQHND